MNRKHIAMNKGMRISFVLLAAVLFCALGAKGQGLPTLSTESNRTYYRINVAINSSPYQSTYNVSPTSPKVSVKSASSDEEKWYFLDAYDLLPSVITKSHLESYCYIVNAKSGEYLYYTGTTIMGNQFNVIEMKAKGTAGTEEDRFKFGIVRSPNGSTENFVIFPKILGENNISNLTVNGKFLWLHAQNTSVVNLSINKGNDWESQWNFITETEDPTCATPVITNVDGSIEITCSVSDAKIYYTTDGTTPSLYNGTLYNNTFSIDYNTFVIKAVAYKSTNDYASLVTTYNVPRCATPEIIDNNGSVTIDCATVGATIYYTTNGSDPVIGSSSTYSGGTLSPGSNDVVKALAVKNGYCKSYISAHKIGLTLTGEGTAASPYLIANDEDFANFATFFASNPNYAGKVYRITADINASGVNLIENPFTGTLEGQAKDDGTFSVIIGLTQPIFGTIDGGTVKNIMLKEVAISIDGNAGAITKVLKGTSGHVGVIYNCGILSGSVGGGTGNNDHVGGLVGELGMSGNDNTNNCYARVINCFSYATITSGLYVAGIVGYNFYSSQASDIRTMVMNCMFYGDITNGAKVSPVYGGEIINNLQGGLSNFNFYAYDKLKTKSISEGKYNCAIAVEEKYLNRFEFYRLLLNSNKKLAAFYVTGSANNAGIMLKWVLETADRTIDNPMPYPILKSQGRYPSIINPDIANAPDSTAVGPNKGGKLGKTLTVNIRQKSQRTDGGQSWPTATTSDVQTTSLPLTRTDKDLDRFNFNYDKVQLPYYNDVGTGNYTENRVVTGWKITDITEIDDDPYSLANYDDSKTWADNSEYFDYPNYNFADRKSSNKDKYTVSGRVFPQGGYFDVPYGVTSITIEPYWGVAVYLADANYDVVYKNDFSGRQNVSQTGTQVGNNTQFNSQSVKNTMSNAVSALSANTTVYDQAIVLWGNYHQNDVPSNGTKAFTIMSVDLDNDHEPDYSLIYHHYQRKAVCPIRFDFLSMPGTSQAQKPNGNTSLLNYTIFKTKGWFEVTNTAFYYSNQIEYENVEDITRVEAPLILLGGVFDQFVSTQKVSVPGYTTYIHLGGNLWVQSLGIGTHGDGSFATPHIPVSVTGGDFKEFYLTGTYNQNADIQNDNAECYISGGRFGELAGACQEQIGDDNNNDETKGNIRWQIYNADIRDFFGGGINNAKPVKGDITTDIFNSRVGTFCGGPKFGDMPTGKKVTTYAEGCVFGKYFGAGYGGLSYAKKKYFDKTTFDFLDLQQKYINDRGKYYDGETTSSGSGAGGSFGFKGPGVATDFDYEFFVWSSGATGARFYVKFASFSLAQCNDVESTLKNCTVNENFYGGGSLGKVTGTVTSELDGTTVKGNVYGAGFSATLQTIEVRDSGFASDGNGGYLLPKYNSASGLFEPGVFSETTTYEWKQVTSYPSNGGVGFINGNHVMTTQNLSKTNLGSVSQNVFLTIKGNSIVFKNVYGGGEESVVDGDTEVKVLDQSKIFGNIYGGGNMGVVGGNTKVIINGQITTGATPGSPNQH